MAEDRRSGPGLDRIVTRFVQSVSNLDAAVEQTGRNQTHIIYPPRFRESVQSATHQIETKLDICLNLEQHWDRSPRDT